MAGKGSAAPQAARGTTILRGGHVLTLEEDFREVPGGDVLIVDGRIEAVGPKLRAPRGARVVDCRGTAVIPGLIQAHVHLCQVLFRNQADGLELLDWLAQRIWPLEAAHDARSLRYSARLGIAELLLGGTTAVLDMGTVHHTEQILAAAEESGIRYVGGKCLMDEGHEGLRQPTQVALDETEALGASWHGRDGGRLRYALCPRFALSCTSPLMDGVRELSVRHGYRVHTHASENRGEVELVRAQTGLDNIRYFQELGLLHERTTLAHCVHLKPAEEKLLAASGTSVAHCPGANLKLASGIARVPRLLAQGINVALGGDGAPCNNTLDAFHEMRLAATLPLPELGPLAMPPREVLATATRRGARALGIEDQVGTLTPGKRADITVVDLAGPHLSPLGRDLHATLVYAARASDVREVFVDGRWLLRDRKLATLDAAALARGARAEFARVEARAGLTPPAARRSLGPTAAPARGGKRR